jgi:predicted phage tail protein
LSYPHILFIDRLVNVYKVEEDGPISIRMQHNELNNLEKQKQANSENFWIFVTKATSDVCTTFYLIEINKQTHKEIYKDLRRFERENVEFCMDFCRDVSPFTKLKSGNYATQEKYSQSEEWQRWYDFYETIKNKKGIEYSCKNLREISKARFWVLIESLD